MTIEKVQRLADGKLFQEVTLDFCWCQVAYYREKILSTFYLMSQPLFAKLLSSTGSVFLPATPSFIAKIYEYKEGLRKNYCEPEFLDGDEVREHVFLVKGHLTIFVSDLDILGKKDDQLAKICTTLQQVNSELSSTGPPGQKERLQRFLATILLDRPLESMKMLRLRRKGP
jgi:hypothetical protein